MTIPLVVIGAGGFGRETLDVIEAINAVTPVPKYEVLGVIDAQPSQQNLQRLADRRINYLGTESDGLARAQHAQFVVGIGSPALRLLVAERFAQFGFMAATLIHPSSGIGSMSQIAAGSVICAGVQVSTNVQLGRHVHLNANSTVGHDSVLADFVSVNPGAIISGEVRVETGCLLGAGSVVLQGLTVAAGAVVGAAACVTRDVEGSATVVGVPARERTTDPRRTVLH